MTEEVKKEEKKVEEPKVETKEEVVQVQYSSEEQRAIDDGWKPKEQFIADGGSEEDWRPAREFNDRGELFGKIDELKKEVKSAKRTVTTLKSHYDKVREVEFDRALETLKKQKKSALEDGDAQGVVNIDEQISSTKEQKQRMQWEASQQVEIQPEVHPDFQNWVSKNRWYERNTDMRDFADGVGFSYKKANPNKTAQEVLKYVEEKVTRAYPDTFRNPRKTAPSPVETSSGSRKVVKENFELTDDEQRVMSRLVKGGVLTEAQYIKDLKDLEKQGKR